MKNTGKKIEQPKQIGKIMEEMGFNPQASMSSKASFIKYLAKAAYNVDVEIPEMYKENAAGSVDSLLKKPEPLQMAFDFEEYKKAE